MKNVLMGGVVLVCAAAFGCAGQHKAPVLKSQAFQNPAPTTAPVVIVPAERHPAPPEPPVVPAPLPEPPPAIQPLAPPGATTATPRPGASLGTSMTIGVVLAEANGHPIYADKVLARIDAELYAWATSKSPVYGPNEFRARAAAAIKQVVLAEIYDELAFAAAQRTNTDEEQQLASYLTTRWRQEEISKAGGSLAIARQRSAQIENMDFDERVTQQYRRWMVEIYLEKHVWSRVQLSAEDMRRFYDLNREELFTEKAGVVFRLIQIGVPESGGRERALAKAKSIVEKARGGSNFAELARSMNDDTGLARNGGYVEMVEKTEPKNPEAPIGDPDYGVSVTRKVGKWYPAGSLRWKEVEKALFAAEKGAVIDPVEVGPAIYVAKLEDKTTGRSLAFDDETVQGRIRLTLLGQQRSDLRQKDHIKLLRSSVYRENEDAINTAVEMAMQKYEIWRKQ